MSNPNDPAMAKSLERPAAHTALLAVITVLVVIYALKLSSPVTLPLAFALFLIGLHWPVQKRLERWLPQGVSTIITLLLFITVVYGILWALTESFDEIRDNAENYQDKLSNYYGNARDFLSERGIEAPKFQQLMDNSGGGADLVGALKDAATGVFDLVAGATLALAFLGLGLLEVHMFKRKLAEAIGNDGERWYITIRRIAKEFQRYIVVRTGIGLITGIAVAVGCWIIGLDYWYLWGLINFLLNYIPTIGSILGVLPPTLFALIQFGDLTMTLITLAVVGGIQLAMGNWIDPLLQGRYLELSPVVVLLSVLLWGWVWGIAGALIGVPLTIVVLLVCREFRSTQWISVLLARDAQQGKVPKAGESANDDDSSPLA